MEAVRFKNGNIHVKKERDDDLKNLDFREVLVKAFDALFTQCDCDFHGEEYCLGNAVGMAQDVYCYNNDRVYCVAYCDVMSLAGGKVGRIILRPMIGGAE